MAALRLFRTWHSHEHVLCCGRGCTGQQSRSVLAPHVAWTGILLPHLPKLFANRFFFTLKDATLTRFAGPHDASLSLFSSIWKFPKTGDPNIDTQNTVILFMRTPKTGLVTLSIVAAEWGSMRALTLRNPEP